MIHQVDILEVQAQEDTRRLNQYQLVLAPLRLVEPLGHILLVDPQPHRLAGTSRPLREEVTVPVEQEVQVEVPAKVELHVGVPDIESVKEPAAFQLSEKTY